MQAALALAPAAPAAVGKPDLATTASVAAAPAPRATSLLRFITCGSVDDGKSTLIGRILYEAGAVFDDQLATLETDSRKFGTQGAALDFALLVDGLSAEREQGITIDVAYRYFATANRSFIVADTPGHEQFTRNMATGASTAEVAIILVDARKGLLPQTRRHSFIVAALGVRDVIVAVNKMDLVGFDEARFRQIADDYRRATATLGFAQVHVVPVSARDGDNVVTRSARTPWYDGEALLPLLETIEPAPRGRAAQDFILPVQWVNRPNLDFRGYAGTLARGRIAVGDALTVLPSRRTTRVARLLVADREATEARAGEAVTLVTTDDIDISRGDVLVSTGTTDIRLAGDLTARLIWTGTNPLDPTATYQLKLATRTVNARVTTLIDRLDIETFAARPPGSGADATLGMNAIGRARISLDAPLATLPYASNRELGGFILVDKVTNETVAFGLVLEEAAGDADATRRDGWADRVAGFIGPAGSLRRRDLLAQASWRIISAALLGGIVLALTGSPVAAAADAPADIAARTTLRALHDHLWRRRPALADLSESGGGI